jgi:LasA protease
LKHTQDGQTPIRYSGEPKKKSKVFFAVSLLIFFSLACSMSMVAAENPYFVAPTISPIPQTTELGPTESNQGVPQPRQEAQQLVLVNPTQTTSGEGPFVPEDVPLIYETQAGDSLPILAARFGVDPSEIFSPVLIPEYQFIPPKQILFIPQKFEHTTPNERFIPDSEVVNSPSAVNFDIRTFVKEAGGYLSTYSEYLMATGNTSGADIVTRIALENSINPRLLLALLEYHSGWVYGHPTEPDKIDYPMGFIDKNNKSLYQQLYLAIKHLSTGYYGWREGQITQLRFKDGTIIQMSPFLNAGTAGLQYYFSKVVEAHDWQASLDVETGFPALHKTMFGDPWIRAASVEPLYPPGLTQPKLILPFQPGHIWAYTGGPHGAWGHEGARAALDFAPGSLESGCVPSEARVLASAPGLVVRSSKGVVVIDLDGDGYEQTGWVLFYLHIATKNRIPEGTWVDTGDFIGHPSCEGGPSTGTHIHIARKYNGEWIPADGPIPFNLDGWLARAGNLPYEGTLTKDGRIIEASVYGVFDSRIIRSHESQ